MKWNCTPTELMFCLLKDLQRDCDEFHARRTREQDLGGAAGRPHQLRHRPHSTAHSRELATKSRRLNRQVRTGVSILS